MTHNSHKHIVTLFSFREGANLPRFRAYIDAVLESLIQEEGFLTTQGYSSINPEARFNHVGIVEFDSMESLYNILDRDDVEVTPPDDVVPMTMLCTGSASSYDLRDTPLDIQRDSVTLVHPFSIPMETRTLKTFAEVGRRNLMVLEANKHFYGHRSYLPTVPTAIHNFVMLQEWASVEAFETHIASDAFKLANRGHEDVLQSGYPEFYKLAMAYNSKAGEHIDNLKSSFG